MTFFLYVSNVGKIAYQFTNVPLTHILLLLALLSSYAFSLFYRLVVIPSTPTTTNLRHLFNLLVAWTLLKMVDYPSANLNFIFLLGLCLIMYSLTWKLLPRTLLTLSVLMLSLGILALL